MPRVPRLFVRTSLVFLLLGFAVGAAFILYSLVTGMGIPRVLTIQHAHILMVGWLANLVFGIAYWMFPRPKSVPYSQGLAEASFWLLNAGLVLRTVFEPIDVLYGVPGLGPLVGTAGIAQLAAGLIFVANIWRRVTGFRPASDKPA